MRLRPTAGLVLALFAAVTSRAVAQADQPARAVRLRRFHFHLTNYMQEGISVRGVPPHHGDAGLPLDPVRHSAAADVVVRELRRLRSDLLPADRRSALLLLVHRRRHRDGVPVAPAGRAGPLRSHDHRLQPRRHVRRGSHPPRAADLSRRLHGDRRVHHPQGVRVVEDRGRGRELHRSGAGPDPGLRGARWGSWS